MGGRSGQLASDLIGRVREEVSADASRNRFVDLLEAGGVPRDRLTWLAGEQSDYVLINHARWDGNLLLFMARQLPKKSFRSYMLANLEAHHLAAMPVLYRLA